MTVKKNNYKKIALALSLCLLIIWGMLGTGASLAWFKDTAPQIKNVFNTADFELVVSHRLENGDYEPIDGKTDIFVDNALYEPGYVQVVYFKVENKGDIAFDYTTAINVLGYNEATNVFGTTFNLRDYLKFGMVTADTEAELEKKLSDRKKAVNIADTALNNYVSEKDSLNAGATKYMALVVRMPEEVGNEANYRGSKIPQVDLGIVILATQQK